MSDRDLLARVRRERARLHGSGPAAVRADGDFDRVAIPTVDGDALRDALSAERATVVIEIGLAYGASALAIAESLVSLGRADVRHVIVDAFQEHFHDAGWQSLANAGVDDRWTLLRERSQTALPRLVSDGLVADAAFVDGSHVFHNVFVDLVFLRELVRPGGLIVLDDCEWPSVGTAVRYFEVNAGWQPVPIANTRRLRAYRLPDPPIDPPFEAFRAFGLGSEP